MSVGVLLVQRPHAHMNFHSGREENNWKKITSGMQILVLTKGRKKNVVKYTTTSQFSSLGVENTALALLDQIPQGEEMSMENGMDILIGTNFDFLAWSSFTGPFQAK